MDRVEQIRAAYQCGKQSCECRQGPNTHCPIHQDNTPSFGVNWGNAGKIVVTCRTGCDQRLIVSKLKEDGFSLAPDEKNVLPFRESRRSSGGPANDETLVRVYVYTSLAGKPLAEKGRFEKGPVLENGKREKTFRWRSPGSPTWTGSDVKPGQLPLYQPQKIREWTKQDKPIYFVEGESACEALIDAGLAATCGAWSASQKDFDQAFEVLRDADVILWPDNDPAGRAYMSKVELKLRDIARSIRWCTPPLPEKGDAADYFKSGKTAADLDRDTPPEKPVVDRIAHDHILIRYPSIFGVVVFDISDMERSSRSLDAEIEIRIHGRSDTVMQRINLTSASARNELRRDLDSITASKDVWPEILLRAFSLARQAYLNYDRSIKIGHVEATAAIGFHIEIMLPDGSHTVLFADGSSGKTFLALLMAVCSAAGIPFLGYEVKQRPVLIVDYETNEQTVRFRIDRICAGLRDAGYQVDAENLAIFYWRARGIPLPDQADAIRRKVEKDGIGLVIVDSAAAACGGEPENASIALRYFTAGLDKIGEGVTTLTIAHIAKGGDTQRPFGSAFWFNQPRRLWYIDREQVAESDTINVTLHCRKVNDGRLPGSVAATIRFSGASGPVVFSKEDARISAQSSSAEIVSIIWNVLTKPRTTKELADMTATNENTVRKVLSDPRHRDRFEQASKGGGKGKATMWQRVAQFGFEDVDPHAGNVVQLTPPPVFDVDEEGFEIKSSPDVSPPDLRKTGTDDFEDVPF